MDYVGIESLRQAYAQEKVDEGDYDRGLAIYQKDSLTPVYEGLALHPEVEPLRKNINEALKDISVDVAALEGELSQAAAAYSALISDTILRLEAVDQKIETEADRLRDINAICGNYEDFGSVKTFDGTNVSGSFGWDNNAFTGVPQKRSSSGITLAVTDVVGNGYEGNEYVKGAIESSRNNIVDGSELTVWEYSRFCGTESPKGAPMIVNTDTEEARSTIFLKGNEAFNTLHLKSGDDIVLEEIHTSDNNVDFQSNLDTPIHLNDKNAKYNDPDYIYDTGLICFPKTKYLKIMLRSSGVTDESIVDKNGNILEGVSRRRISIDDIEAANIAYGQAEIKTNDLVSRPIDCIAIFANEYVPAHYADDGYVTYYLTVNEKEYEVVPINSNKSGTKVIRFTSYTTGDSYVKHIKESIKSASLRVVIKTTADGCTPFLSNLKVCLGKVVST